jgi:hypothetical protein
MTIRPFYPGPPSAPKSLPTWLTIAALALLLLTGIAFANFNGRPVRRFAPIAALILLVVSTGYLAGCAETPVVNPNGTPSGSYGITVTATSGTDVHTTVVTLVVQ